ncbi:MAG: cobalt ECF transporter T component CbiQ [Anaerolineae bacterium]
MIRAEHVFVWYMLPDSGVLLGGMLCREGGIPFLAWSATSCYAILTMKHSFLDLYREGHSPIHLLDARIKLGLTLAFILAASLVPSSFWPSYAALLGLALAAIGLAAVPMRLALERSLVAVPFALMAAASLPFVRPGRELASLLLGPWRLVVTLPGVLALAEVLARSWLSVLVAGLLTATTPFPDLLAALQALGVPRLLVAVISFLYRYLFVLVDEAQRLSRAREARSAWVEALCCDGRRAKAGGTIAWRARVLGGMVGSLFVRSYERSERVYQAMLARGFDGVIRNPKHPRPALAQLGAGLCVLAALAAIVAVGYWKG